MSVVRAEITLKNGADVILAKQGYIKEDEVRQMTVQSIVDTGAWTMVINEGTRDKLGLLDQGIGEATLADGQKEEYPWRGRWKSGGKTAALSATRWYCPTPPTYCSAQFPLRAWT